MKTKRIKAELHDTFSTEYRKGLYYEEVRWIGEHWELPADAESYAKLAQQVDEAIERGINRWLAGTAGPDGCRRLPHEVLRAVGITQPKKGRK